MITKASLGLALLVGAALPVQATPVTWDFVLTSILFCNIPSACHFNGVPRAIAELILPSDTSTGRTTFDAFPISRHPITQGDDFSFRFFSRPAVSQTAPPDGVPGNPTGFGPGAFDISWVETPGSLVTGIDYETEFDGIQIRAGIGPQGNVTLASDTDLGGILTGTQAFGVGDWRIASTVPVGEPSTLGLLAAAGLGWGLLFPRRRSDNPEEKPNPADNRRPAQEAGRGDSGELNQRV